jgi:hypothetical protein
MAKTNHFLLKVDGKRREKESKSNLTIQKTKGKKQNVKEPSRRGATNKGLRDRKRERADGIFWGRVRRRGVAKGGFPGAQPETKVSPEARVAGQGEVAKVGVVTRDTGC